MSHLFSASRRLLLAAGVAALATPLLSTPVLADEPLKIDAQIPPHLIDHVRAGLEVDILFPAFNRHMVTPVKLGKRYSLVTWFVGPKFR